jgi:putative ABC transport system ATP-binding protein
MAVIETKDVGKIFDTSPVEVEALANITLLFDRGECTIIKGPSGSGKTTLLSILGCLLTPTSGSVSILGETISGLSPKQLRSLRLNKMGFVFQNFNLLEALTIEENVAIAGRLRGASAAKALEDSKVLLERVGLEKRLGFLPKDISQGEKQRVAIARAFVNDPDIIIADEPTANLDSKTGRSIIAMIRELAIDKAIIIATHDDRITKMADKIIMLEDGRVGECSN